MNGQRRILLVCNGDPLSLIFSDEAYETESVHTEREAIEKARGNNFNVAIVDANLPGIDAAKLIAGMKEASPRVDIVVVSAQENGESTMRSLNHWASDYIASPVNSDEALAKVEKIIDRQQLIAERLRVEEALRESEQLLRTLLEYAPNAIVILDVNTGRFVDANKNAERLYKLSREELFKVGPVEMSPTAQPDGRLSREVALERIEEVLSGGVPVFEWTCRTSEGDLIPCEVRLVQLPIAGRCLIRGSISDITERKRSEESLKVHARQQAAVAHLGQHALAGSDLKALMNEAVALIAETLDVEYCKVLEILPDNHSMILRAGVGWKERLIGQTVVDITANSQASFTLASNEPVVVENLETESRFNRPYLLLEHGVVSGMSVIISGQTGPFGVLGAHSIRKRAFNRDDINFLQAIANVLATAIERKRAEEALRQAEAKHRSLIENAAYGIYTSTPEGKLLDFNPALMSMLGYESAEELATLDIAADIFQNPEERERLLKQYELSKQVERVEVQWKRRDGNKITVRLSGRAAHNEQGHLIGFEFIAENITERRSLEEQLRQSQKMEAIGRLAGGIAHDFNNLLTAIIGYDQLVLSRLEEDSPIRKELEEILKAGQRAAALTGQLLAFSRKQVLQPKVLDLNLVIENSARILKRLIGEDIELTTIQAPSIGRVKADPLQIEQVIMNLAVNARDAMPEGGKVIIETSEAYLDEDYARNHVGVRPGPYVLLSVTDTGCGMNEEIRSRIFEPFFTTKEQGKGTGLGLSTIYGIVKQSDGHLWVHSERGKGATFKIYLPTVEEPAELIPSQALGAEMLRGEETVLVVEDEEAVRKLARQTLEVCGYTVLSAANGIEAIQICEQHEGSIDMVLTDVVMPQMSGSELIEHMASLYPGIKALCMSGYSDNAILRHNMLNWGEAFLQKPFSPQALAGKVREVLDG